MPEEGKDKGFSFDALSKSLESQLDGSSDDAATGEVGELTDSDVISGIRTSSTSIVTFFRDDCPFCERLMPILDELADDYKSKVVFRKVNVDKFEKVREEFKVLGVPLDEYDQWIESIHSGLRPMGIDEGPSTRIE